MDQKGFGVEACGLPGWSKAPRGSSAGFGGVASSFSWFFWLHLAMSALSPLSEWQLRSGGGGGLRF